MIWEVRKNGNVFAHGPVETMPPPEQRRQMRAAGYEIYLDGKLYRK